MNKGKSYKSRETKDGFVKFSTLLHRKHIEAIDKIVSSREGIRRGLTKRDVIYQMISRYLNEDQENSMGIILSQMKLEFDREFRGIKQRQQALIEMLAHFVRIYLGHAPSLLAEEKDAFRAKSKERFEKYSDVVVRMLKNRSDFYETISEKALLESYRRFSVTK